MKADRLRDELHSWTYFLYTLCNVILAYVLQMQFEHEETNLKTWEAWHLFKEIGVVDVYNKCLNELFVYFFSSYFYGNKLCMVLDKILLWKFDYSRGNFIWIFKSVLDPTFFPNAELDPDPNSFNNTDPNSTKIPFSGTATQRTRYSNSLA